MITIDNKPVSEDKFSSVFTRLSDNCRIVIVREPNPTMIKTLDTVGLVATFYFKEREL